MPKGYSNDLGGKQFLGKELKKYVVKFSDAQYINTEWNVSRFKSIDSGRVAFDLERWVKKIQLFKAKGGDFSPPFA